MEETLKLESDVRRCMQQVRDGTDAETSDVRRRMQQVCDGRDDDKGE